jgi:hypothetical protein
MLKLQSGVEMTGCWHGVRAGVNGLVRGPFRRAHNPPAEAELAALAQALGGQARGVAMAEACSTARPG